MKKIVVLTGAGISAESGISTFRDSGGLWEGHDIMEVASPEGWAKNNALVLDFYNKRRKNVIESKPNLAHWLLSELENDYDVQIITQNVDDLHERAGSTKVLHLHGKITESSSSIKPNLVYPIEGYELNLGEKCELGSQLRPNIVWFGEEVPALEIAIDLVEKADIFVVIGTSMVVYPAAGLINYVPKSVMKYIIDPNMPDIYHKENLIFIQEKATIGVPKFINLI